MGVCDNTSISFNVYSPLISCIGIHHPKINKLKAGQKLDTMSEVDPLATFYFKIDSTCNSSKHLLLHGIKSHEWNFQIAKDFDSFV